MDVQVINPVGGIKLEIDNPNHGIKTAGSTPIPDAGIDPHVIQLARWAVNEYGREQGLPMAFGKVISWNRQALQQGMAYYITLDAANTDLGVMEKYLAIVFEPINGLVLLQFRYIGP